MKDKLTKLLVGTLALVLVLFTAAPVFSPTSAVGADEAQISGSEATATGGGGGNGTGGGDGNGGGTGVHLVSATIIKGKPFDVGEETEFTIEEPVPADLVPLYGFDNMQKCYFVFDKNVAMANAGQDDAFIEHNKSLITLVEKSGAVVDGYETRTYISDFDSRRVLHVFTYEWLKPLTTYQIFIEPGIQAANGVDVSTERYVFTFTTDAACSNGFNLYQNILFISIPVLLLIGIIAAIIRRRKLRYG